MMDTPREDDAVARMSPYESGELTDSIFLILLATLEPIHGYRIMQVIADMTSGSVQIGPATMYTTLRKLSDAGWIEEVREDDSKILYRITTSGDNILRADVARRRMIMTIVETTLGEKED